MAKYHINVETGEPGPCRAEKGHCPFGGDDQHYDSPILAREVYEKAQGGSFLKRSRGIAKRMLVIGGMAVTGVSLVGCATNIGLDENGDPVKPADSPSISQPVEQHTDSEPGPIEEAEKWVDDHPVNAPNSDEIEDWLNEKSEQVNKWLNENGEGVTPPITYEADGIYFQGRSLEATPEEIAEAKRILETLVVQPAYDDGNYDRDAMFGRGFQTGVAGAVEHRDVPNATFRNDSPQARVVSGTFIDPYTGEPVEVIGGESYDADIDHIVPLKEVYVSQTIPLSGEQMKEYANNLDNLVYTASGVNRSKGDQDASTWLPSYEPSKCIYVVKQIEIKGKYNLAVDSAEKAAMQQVINTKCVN